jgi:hypothetical protein
MTTYHGTLLQVHYHNRPGGVATVMHHYANAFAHACRGLPHSNLIVCCAGVKAVAGSGDIRIVDVKDCDYRSFGDRASFLRAKKRIGLALSSIIDRRAFPRPIVVVGHNMNLGKNCALSSAFADTARRFSLIKDRVRFFSVVHDYAEEGRTGLLSQIKMVQDFDVDIWNDLYPSLWNLHFVSPSSRNASLLKKAGFPTTVLENPVVKSPATMLHDKKSLQRKKLRAALFEIAKKENVRLRSSRPVVLYPTRVISRKNPVEAVLVAHVVFQSNLLFGAYGTSPADRSLAEGLKKICVKYGVPVVFDAGRIAGRADNSFSMLYDVADLCMTTSIAEGFGYAIHEPALYGKNIIGRCPDGFSVSGKHENSYLYKRLLIPCAWVQMDEIKSRYYDRLRNVSGWYGTFPAFNSFSKMFDASFIRNNGIDFGCLDATTQLTVLSRCVASPQDALAWKQTYSSQTRRLMISFHAALSGRPRAAAGPSYGAFERSFTQCYCTQYAPARLRANADPKALLRYFSKPRHFRPLMNPQHMDSNAMHAVFA